MRPECTAAAWLLLLLVACNDSRALPELRGSRPNVVFSLSDDQSRFDHSAYGNEKVPTPTTDALAKEGLVFDKAFTGQAVCAPSRSMLFSGLYPLRNGCFLNHTSIRPGVVTLPAYLEELGYEVVLAGKSHVKPVEQFAWTHYFPPKGREGLPHKWIPLKEVDGYFGSAQEPFCMVVASEYPHAPYIKETPYRAEDVLLPPFVPKSAGKTHHAAQYYASIAEKERELAAVLKLIDRHGLRENTVVFYGDDHGAVRGKFTVYDSGLNVAFIVSWPGRIQPGRTSGLASFADFVPTVIELAGGQVPDGLDGRSLLPVLEGRTQTHHEYVYGVAHNQGTQSRHVFPQRSVHDGRYHYVFNFNSMERVERERAAGKPVDYFLERGAGMHPSLPEEMLFDTLSDPHELDSRAHEEELNAVKARLEGELFRWMRSQNDFLEEGGAIPFLAVRRNELDEPSEEFNYELPEEQIGVLAGRKQDPHRITQP